MMPGCSVLIRVRPASNGFGRDAQQIKIGRHRAVRLGQAIDIKHAAIGGTGFAGDLLGGGLVNGAFAEHRRDIVFAHRVDHAAHLLRRALADRR